LRPLEAIEILEHFLSPERADPRHGVELRNA